jgi:hypothetical protein
MIVCRRKVAEVDLLHHRNDYPKAALGVGEPEKSSSRHMYEEMVIMKQLSTLNYASDSVGITIPSET